MNGHAFTPFTSSKPLPNTPITVFMVIKTFGSTRFAIRNTSIASFLRTTIISIFLACPVYQPVQSTNVIFP